MEGFNPSHERFLISCEVMNIWKTIEILVFVIRGYSKVKEHCTVCFSRFTRVLAAVWVNFITHAKNRDETAFGL